MRLVVTFQDQVAARFGNQLGALGDEEAFAVMKSALWRGGNQARTQVKRALSKQTGIKYGLIDQAMETHFRGDHASGMLEYELIGHGGETNVGLFGAIQRKSGISARPWNKRRIFRGSFFAYGKKVYERIDPKSARGPIRQIMGPNIGRELTKDDTRKLWEEAVPPAIMKRIEHELSRRMPKG